MPKLNTGLPLFVSAVLDAHISALVPVTASAGRFTPLRVDLVVRYSSLPQLWEDVIDGVLNALPEAVTQYSMGLYVLFFGTQKNYAEIAHHTIWMGPRFKELLTDIFDKKILADDFSLYLHRPTATDPSFAAIKTVHVINSCHLDIGFADSSAGIINEYFDHHLPLAALVGEQGLGRGQLVVR